MKKIFTIMIALLAMAFVSNAQALLSEGFESGTLPTGWTTIDNDNDSYTWDPAFGFDGHNGGLCISSASYINNVGALTPDNWLITPAINLTANATLTFWVCGQDASYANEHYGVYISTTGTAISNFTLIYEETINAAGGSRDQGTWKQKTVNLASYTGQTVYIAFRHFNCTDEYWLNLDDVEIFAQPTSATIIASPAALTFGTTPVGNTTAAQTITVAGYSLIDDVIATVDGPFEISADGTTFGSSATLAAAGGTLYVQFAPTADGNATGTLTLSSLDADDVTISLTGEGVDCSGSVSTLPWTEDFSGEVFPPLCWSLVSTNELTWSSFDYSGVWASCEGAEDAVQHEELITKTFDFTNYTATVLMDLVFMSNYTYIYNGTADLQIFASTDGGATFGTTPIWSLSQVGEFENWTPTTATVNLSSLAGQSNVVLDFVYAGDTVQILFTNLNIYDMSEPTMVADVEAISYYTEVGTADVETVNVAAYNMTAAPVATTTAPFAVSVDGTTFSTTATLPMEGGVLYVQYTGTNGDQTGNVTISAAGATDAVIALAGTGYSCGGFPISEDFNHAGALPGCWTLVYGNNDPDVNPMSVIPYEEGSEDYAFRFSSYNTAEDYNQYLISPEIESNDELMISFDYMVYYGSEKFKVGYSTTGNDVADFTWLNSVTASNSNWSTYQAAIPQGAKYVAIDYFSNYAYYLYVDNIEIKTNTSVEDHAQAAVRVYPNPAADFVTIAADANINNVEVFNMAGQMVLSVDANDVTTTINTTSLAKGLYTVRINTVNGTVNQRIAVAR